MSNPHSCNSSTEHRHRSESKRRSDSYARKRSSSQGSIEGRHRSESKRRSNSNAHKRSSSRGSSGQEQREASKVHLQDCEHLIREEWVSLPGGFTKSGHPLLIFTDKKEFYRLPVSDLHILLQYYISVVPKSEQVEYKFIISMLTILCFSESRICFDNWSPSWILARCSEHFY